MLKLSRLVFIALLFIVQNKTKVYYCLDNIYQAAKEIEKWTWRIEIHCGFSNVKKNIENVAKYLGELNSVNNYEEQSGKQIILNTLSYGSLIKYLDNVPEIELLRQNVRENEKLKQYENIIVPISEFLLNNNFYSTYIAGFIANFIYSLKNAGKFEPFVFEKEGCYLEQSYFHELNLYHHYKDLFAGKYLMDYEFQDIYKKIEKMIDFKMYRGYGGSFGFGICGWKDKYLYKLLEYYLAEAKDKNKIDSDGAIQAEIKFMIDYGIKILKSSFEIWSKEIFNYNDIKSQIKKAVEISYLKYCYEQMKDLEMIEELAANIYELFTKSTVEGPFEIEVYDFINTLGKGLFSGIIDYKQNQENIFDVSDFKIKIETYKKDNYELFDPKIKYVIDYLKFSEIEYFENDKKEEIEETISLILKKTHYVYFSDILKYLKYGKVYVKYKTEDSWIELIIYPDKDKYTTYNGVIIFKISYSPKYSDLSQYRLYEFEKLPKLRLSSFNTRLQDSEQEFLLKMKSPFDDKYIFNIENIYDIIIYDENGVFKSNMQEKQKEFEFKKDEIIFIEIRAVYKSNILLLVNPTSHVSLLPYEPIFSDEKYDTTSVPNDPLKPNEIKFSKRKGYGLYINCNNPERLLQNEHIDVLNKCIKKNYFFDVEVFFTMEHNNLIEKDIYMGYLIENIGRSDLYITVKNLGFNVGEKEEDWYGIKEWVDFYNTKFDILNKDRMTKEQLQRLEEIIPNIHEPNNNQPITFRIPKGQKFFVLGGTSQDSFNGINVFDSANKKIPTRNIVNGVVLFEVIGSANGYLYVYDDYKNIKFDDRSVEHLLIKEGNEDFSRVYKGYDEFKGVIEGKVFWEINDLTKPQNLPVKITNYYADGFSLLNQEPFSEIKNTKPHTGEFRQWITNANPQKCMKGDEKSVECLERRDNVIGEDLITFRINDKNFKDIIIDNYHNDGSGKFANTANWMINYIVEYILVNRGNSKRTIKVTMSANGILTALVVDKEGKVIQGTEQFAVLVDDKNNAKNNYYHNFEYSTTVEPHSVSKFYVEYTLLPNSCGRVTHQAELQ